MKQCNKCNQLLPDENFHKRIYKNGTVKLQPTCKECKQQISKERYKSKRTHILSCNATWREDNREKMQSLRKQWWENRPNAGSYYQSLHRARKRGEAVNSLSDAQIQEIREIYDTCPDGYHVDHIIPRNGKTVCGLHVPSNLQHLPASENVKKSNKLVV